jgi:hypothetical protein
MENERRQEADQAQQNEQEAKFGQCKMQNTLMQLLEAMKKPITNVT